MAAAAGAVQVLLGLAEPAALGVRLASWVDGARTDDGRRGLLGQLTRAARRGGAAAAGRRRRRSTACSTGSSRCPTRTFLARLPALRGGFDALSPAARDRLLAVVDERLGETASRPRLADDPDALLRPAARRPGRAGARSPRYGLPPPADPDASVRRRPSDRARGPTRRSDRAGPRPAGAADAVRRPDRWRLVLGRQHPTAAVRRRRRLRHRAGRALRRRHGARAPRADGAGRAGREAPFPGVREWSEELAALFGAGRPRGGAGPRPPSPAGRTRRWRWTPTRCAPRSSCCTTVLSLAGGAARGARWPGCGRWSPASSRS